MFYTISNSFQIGVNKLMESHEKSDNKDKLKRLTFRIDMFTKIVKIQTFDDIFHILNGFYCFPTMDNTERWNAKDSSNHKSDNKTSVQHLYARNTKHRLQSIQLTSID